MIYVISSFVYHLLKLVSVVMTMRPDHFYVNLSVGRKLAGFAVTVLDNSMIVEFISFNPVQYDGCLVSCSVCSVCA